LLLVVSFDADRERMGKMRVIRRRPACAEPEAGKDAMIFGMLAIEAGRN